MHLYKQTHGPKERWTDRWTVKNPNRQTIIDKNAHNMHNYKHKKAFGNHYMDMDRKTDRAHHGGQIDGQIDRQTRILTTSNWLKDILP